MLSRERITTIFKLAFPVAIALSSTLIMTLIDLVMVRPVGIRATAAVGLSIFSYTLVLSSVIGIGLAVQGLVARRRGQGSPEPKCLPLNAGLVIALIIGIPLTIIAYFLAPFFFSLISSDPAVTKIGIPFLRALYTTIIASGMNAAFKGHWTGMEKPSVFMLIVVFMSSMNFCGNYILITGRFGAPALGATGAAISTAVSVHVGLLLNLVITWLHYRKDGFLSAKPAKSLVMRVFRLGLPATAQEFFRSAGYIVLYWMIGKIGTAELAAINVQVRVAMMASILSMSLGSASATLVGRTLGEGDPAGAARWGWDAAKIGITVITLLALPLVVFPRFFLSMFISDPRTLSIATRPWQMVMGLVGVGSLISIFAYTLVSVGDGKRVAIVSFGTQWFIFLPAVWVIGPYLHYGLLQISYLQVIYGAVSTAIITAIWSQGRWQKIVI